MKNSLIPVLVVAIAATAICPPFSLARSGSGLASLDQDAAQLRSSMDVPNGRKTVSLSVDNENIRDVLRDLAAQGGFNLVMDESVSGNVTIELNRVSLNQALESVAALGDLKILKQGGNIFLVLSRQAAQDKGLDRQLSKVIPIYYSNANRVAAMLNSSIFASSGQGSGGSSSSGGSTGGASSMQKARADARTNSLILVGTNQDIALAEAAIAKLDVPRQSKTFYLSHANAVDVATLLAGSVFNDGNANFKIGGTTTTSTTSTTNPSSNYSISPTTVRVERQDVQEGTGISSFGSNGNGTSAGLSATVTLRGMVKAQDNASISPDSAMIVPDTRQNAITILGTAEQIALAESLIPTMDAQLPQVSIEASLVEITDTNSLQLGSQLGIADGKLQVGFNNSAMANVSGNGLVGLSTVNDPTDLNSLARTGISFATNPAIKTPNYALQINNLVTKNKAKILANPTVVATHDTESIISIVNEVVHRIVTTVDASGFATQTVEIGEAGIVMDILPKVGEDGTITLRVRPSITEPLPEITIGTNKITPLRKRDLLTQNVRMRDGETLVIGGLIQQQDSSRNDKVPALGDLPIISAMFRASRRTSERSELVLMITPHIINNLRVTPVNTTTNAGPTQTSMAGGK